MDHPPYSTNCYPTERAIICVNFSEGLTLLLICEKGPLGNLSENLKLRPWQFFEAVLNHLLAAYAALVGTLAPTLDLEVIRHLMLVDSSTLRVADRLIQIFPGHKTGRKAEWAAVKLHTAFRLFRSVQVLALTAEKVNDKSVNFLRPWARRFCTCSTWAIGSMACPIPSLI